VAVLLLQLNLIIDYQTNRVLYPDRDHLNCVIFYPFLVLKNYKYFVWRNLINLKEMKC